MGRPASQGPSISSDLQESVLKQIKDKGVKFISLQFVDMVGTAKSCEITLDRFKDVLDSGLWFDGSSVEGFARIHESDMILFPDLSTFSILPWTDNAVARIACDAFTPDKRPFEGDPRMVLRRALSDAANLGFDFRVGPEVEFFLFKSDNGAPKPVPHDSAGYFDLSPVDLGASVKREVIPYLQAMGVNVEMSHHECGPGQHEIDFRYCDAMSAALNVITLKNVVKVIARKYGLSASFMPKPVFGLPGSGMHVHQSLWSKGANRFYDEDDPYHLSDTARWFIGGQLAHARAIAAVTNPIVNSYKRLVSGFEAPVYICWGRRNRSALIRVPDFLEGKHNSARCELRCPDPSCNPYLAFSVMLAAGLDGIKRKLDPPEAVEEDVYEFDDSKLGQFYINSLPNSLAEAVQALEGDKVVRDALGEHVFEKLSAAQMSEWDEYKVQVTSWEFDKYFPTV